MGENGREPAGVFHPSSYILDEIFERDWRFSEFVAALQGDDPQDYVPLLAELMVRPLSGVVYDDESCRRLAGAFGTSPDLWRNLYMEWHRSGPRELLCEICNREYVVWSALNEVWNRVIRTDGTDEWNFLCPSCFCQLAKQRADFCLFMVPYQFYIDHVWKEQACSPDCAVPESGPTLNVGDQ